MNNTLYFRFLLVFMALGIAQLSFAQRADDPKRMEKIDPKELPRLEKMVINGVEKKTSPNPIVKEKTKDPFISDTEAKNRSEVDGRISGQEIRIIQYARSLPQTE